METTKGTKLPKRRAGYYYDIPTMPSNEGYPSVTTILKVLAKPEIDWWAGKIRYEYYSANPDATIGEFMDAPNKVMRKAGDEGSIAHNLIDESFKLNPYDKAKQNDKVQAYLEGFEKFQDLHQPIVIETEGTVYSHTEKFAGTYDGLFKIGGQVWLIDWKTSNGIYWTHKVQLVAYYMALKEMGKHVDNMGIVQLKNNGEFLLEKVGQVENDIDLFEAFKSAKYLYNTKQVIK